MDRKSQLINLVLPNVLSCHSISISLIYVRTCLGAISTNIDIKRQKMKWSWQKQLRLTFVLVLIFATSVLYRSKFDLHRRNVHFISNKQQSMRPVLGPCATYGPIYEWESFKVFNQHIESHDHMVKEYVEKTNTAMLLTCVRSNNTLHNHKYRNFIQDKDSISQNNATENGIRNGRTAHEQILVMRDLKHACATDFQALTHIEQYMCQHTWNEQCSPLEYNFHKQIQCMGTNKCSTLRIRLTETLHGKLTQGGSSFDTYVHHKQTGAMELCSVQDHFNGTYNSWCPLYQGCVLVTITRVFQAFIGFLAPETKYKTETENVEVLKEQVCMEAEEAPQLDVPGWRLQGSTWWWHPELWYTPADIEQCLSQLNSLTFIGASHLRFMADYILVNLGQTTESHGGMIPDKAKYQREVKYKNFHYMWTRLTYMLTARLFGMLQKEKVLKSKRDVIVMMSGSHDLESRSLGYYVNEAVPRVASVLKKIKSSPQWRHARMIWVNNIAHPEKLSTRRNNVILQAANAQLEK